MVPFIYHSWNDNILEICNKLVVTEIKEKVGMGIKGQYEGSLWWQKYSVSWLHQCKYSGCDIVL